MTHVFFDDAIDLFGFIHLAKEWDLDFIQLRPGKFRASIAQVLNPDFQLGYAGFNCPVKQEGTSPPGIWTFAFINSPMYWRNFVLDQESIIIYAPGSEIHGINESRFDVLVFSVMEGHLEEVAKKSGCEYILDTINNFAIIKSDLTKRANFGLE